MELSLSLHKEIVVFLLSLPNIQDNDSRRALFYHAELDSELLNQIQFDKPTAQFVPLSVSTIIAYGKINDGRYAMKALLQATKSYIGQDRKEYCDNLIKELYVPANLISPERLNKREVTSLKNYPYWQKVFSYLLLTIIIIPIIVIIYQKIIIQRTPLVITTPFPIIDRNDEIELKTEKQSYLTQDEFSPKKISSPTVRYSDDIVSEINRSLHPIKDVYISFSIHVPMDHVELREYVERLQKEITKIIPQIGKGKWIQGIVGGSLDVGRNPKTIQFDKTSPLIPNASREKLAYTILAYADVELQFYKKPINIDEHTHMNWISEENKPDLKISFFSYFDSENEADEHSIEYQITPPKLGLDGSMISSDPKYWENTGNIVSIPDLLGSQMLVWFPPTVISGDAIIDQYLPEIRRRFELETLTISMSNGREFCFTSKQLMLYHDQEGYPLYMFMFPETMEALVDLNRFNR